MLLARRPHAADATSRLSTATGRERRVMPEECIAYLITFRTYGTWLHGDDRGSTEPDHNAWGEPRLLPNFERRNIAASRMTTKPITFTAPERSTVERAIRSHCAHQDWRVLALNVRTEHVHIVVSSARPPERVMNALKSYATRALRDADNSGRMTNVWSRHGSTRRVWAGRNQ